MMTLTMEQDRQIAEVVAQQGGRLRAFIRHRVPRESDAEDLLQEVLYELVRAHRLLQPIDHLSGWLFRVARNRITDLFRRKRPELFSEAALLDKEGEALGLEDLLPSPDDGPEAQLLRKHLLEELDAALAQLPVEQRDVFLANEIDGRSFRELSEATGVSINTLLARKRYAVLALHRRLQRVHNELKAK